MAWAVMWWMIRLGGRRNVSCRGYAKVACCGVNFGGGYFGCGIGVDILIVALEVDMLTVALEVDILIVALEVGILVVSQV